MIGIAQVNNGFIASYSHKGVWVWGSGKSERESIIELKEKFNDFIDDELEKFKQAEQAYAAELNAKNKLKGLR